jgi:hypothetical protein
MKRTVVALLLAAAAATAAEAQLPSTPRDLGMGGSSMGLARGQEALWTNPANLGLADAPYWSIGFPQVGTGTTILGPSAGDLATFFLNDDSPERAREILARVPRGGMEVDLGVRAPLVAVQRRGLAVGIGYGSAARQTVGRDIVDLLLLGYEDGRTDYSVGNTSSRRFSYWDFMIGYGRAAGPVSVGVTGHYYRGGRVAQTRAFDPRIDPAAGTVELEWVEVSAPRAGGMGLDLGVAMQPSERLTVGASLANAVSSMGFGEGLRVRQVTITRDDLIGDPDAFWNVRSRLRASERDLDPSGSSPEVLQTRAGLLDDNTLPRTLRLGAAYSLQTRTDLAFGVQTELNGGRLGGWWSDMVSIGIQHGLPRISVRAGYATDLADGRMISGGLTLGPIQVGLGRIDVDEVDGIQRSGWIGSFGMGIRTTGLASYAGGGRR